MSILDALSKMIANLPSSFLFVSSFWLVASIWIRLFLIFVLVNTLLNFLGVDGWFQPGLALHRSWHMIGAYLTGSQINTIFSVGPREGVRNYISNINTRQATAIALAPCLNFFITIFLGANLDRVYLICEAIVILILGTFIDVESEEILVYLTTVAVFVYIVLSLFVIAGPELSDLRLIFYAAGKENPYFMTLILWGFVMFLLYATMSFWTALYLLLVFITGLLYVITLQPLNRKKTSTGKTLNDEIVAQQSAIELVDIAIPDLT